MSQSPPAPNLPASAPAPHTLLVQAAGDGSGSLLLTHMVCGAPPTYVASTPHLFDDKATTAVGVRMIDLIQASIGHECPPGAPRQTVGSLL